MWFNLGLMGMLAAIFIQNRLLLEIQEKTMATVQELKDSLKAIGEGVDALELGLKDLKAQVAAGGVVSQADLDELAAKAAEVVADIKDTTDQE